MQQKEIQYQVPQDARLRKELRLAVENWFTGSKPIPPVAFSTLWELSEQFCNETGTDSRWLAYIMILLNNSLWLEPLSGVPIAQRLLLLPKCLADSEKCAGAIDHFGLLCNKCGACHVPEVEKLAAELGYVSMVAEGSPIVAELIRSGQVSGIIGISCLEALEKAFGHISKAAIAGVAIPLLTDGCKDTTADLELLREIMYLPYDSRHSQPDYHRLADIVKSWFGRDYISDLTGFYAGPESQTRECCLDYITGDGKRYRPFITAAVYVALSESCQLEALPAEVVNTSLAIEFFHKASLVHDDIEDNDSLRYDHPTLNALYGNAFAINAGDYLIGSGYRILAELSIDPAIKGSLMAEIALAHQQLTIGQGLELEKIGQKLTLEEVLEIFRAKTSPAFRAAMKCGAILAGADTSILSILDELSDLLGIAYQIKDDVDDIEHDINELSIMHCFGDISNSEKADKARAMQEHYTDLCRAKLVEIKHFRLKVFLTRLVEKIAG